MAGIAGAPAPRPSDLTPQPGPASALDAMPEYQAPKGPSALDSMPSQAAPQPQASQYTGPGSSTLQGIADVAPEAMGIAGGIAGRAAGIPGMVGMGMSMATGGMGIRQVIEQDILGSAPKQSTTDRLIGMRDAAGKIGAELITGEAAIRGIAKGGALALETKMGQMFSDRLASQVQPVVDYASNFVDNIKKSLIKPAADWLEQNMAQGTAEQSGDTIKGKFQQVIGDKYAAFTKRYAGINGASADTIMPDAQRLRLTTALRNDSVDLPQNIHNMVKTYASKIDGATNAQDVHQVISDVNNEVNRLSAYQTSPAVRDKISALQQFSDRATDFMEDYTHGIAKRVASGNASMGEMQGFQKMMEQQANPTVPVGEQNLQNYAKSVAKDYIDQRKNVTQDYAKFRSFLSDTGEQAGVSAEKLGPMQFMREIDRVPSEQLVQRMFLPKNAAALREMATTSPDVFQAVKGARIRDIYNNSMVDGKIDIGKLANNFDALPESSRPLIISNAERAQLRSVADNSNLGALDRMHDNMITQFVKSSLDLTRAGAQAGAKVASDAYGTNAGKALSAQLVGGAAVAATGRNPVPGQ